MNKSENINLAECVVPKVKGDVRQSYNNDCLENGEKNFHGDEN